MYYVFFSVKTIKLREIGILLPKFKKLNQLLLYSQLNTNTDIFLSFRYTYVDLTNEKSDDDDEDSNMNNIPLDEKPTTSTNE